MYMVSSRALILLQIHTIHDGSPIPCTWGAEVGAVSCHGRPEEQWKLIIFDESRLELRCHVAREL